jgi:hypothetical protein
MAPNASAVHSFMPLARKFSWQSALDAYTGPISVANRDLIYAFDIRHPNGTIFWVFSRIKANVGQEKCFEGQDSPHSKNMSGAEDPEEHFEGQDSLHSKNMSGAEDPEKRFEGQNSLHLKNMSGTEDSEK